MTTQRPATTRLALTCAAAGVVAAYSLYHYREALLTFYFLDDFWVMHDAAQVHLGSAGDLLQFFRFGHMGFAMYRPLSTVAYSYLLQSLVGFDASAQHACQLLIFTLNTVLAFAVTHKLTGSVAAATAAGLFYAGAPGQAVNAYWLSAFTVTGTAFWLLVMMVCWVYTSGRWRVLLCTWAQLCGLASAEHAVAGPVLLAILAAMRREPLRRSLAAITPSAVLVAVYLIAKLYYLAYLRPPAAEVVLRGYGLSMDVTIWLDHLGQYLAQCFTPLTLWDPSGGSTLLLGCGLVLVLALAAWRAYRAPGPCDLVAGGIALFIGSLAAVFPQRTHFGSPYICVAVLGAAWLVIGLCRLAGRHGDRLALLLAIAVLVVDAQTGERAWRTPVVFRLVVNGSLTAARWMDAAGHAARADHQDVLMPRNAVTGFMFEMGKAETFFPGLPKRVTLYRPSTPPRPRPEQVVLTAEAPLTTPTHFPGAQPRWNWLRALVAPPTGRMYLGADRQFVAQDEWN